MPSAKATYTHRPNFSPADFSLKPHRPQERRFVPSAFAPNSGEAAVTHHYAEFTFEYTVKEVPERRPVQLGDSIVATFGKFTRKLLMVNIGYANLDELDAKVRGAILALKGQKRLVPQDSIRRNYDMTATILNYLADVLLAELPKIKEELSREAE
jgi:hypothetical protein